MTLTVATLADAATIARLEDAFPARQRWSEQAWAEEIAATDRRVFVARDGEEIAAVASWRTAFDLTELHRVLVAPAHRRRGLATQLVRRGLDEAAALGIATASLEVEEANEAAIALYERLGFSTTARRPHYYGHDRHALIMEATCREPDGEEQP